MPRNDHTNLPADTATLAAPRSKELRKKEFGRRLHSMMLAKGWSQSELGRKADLPRDSISTYIRAKTLPTPQNLEALANALNVEPEELLPNHTDSVIGEESSTFEMKVSGAGIAWVRVNRQMSMATAIKIAELLENDRALDQSGCGGASAV